MRAWSIITTLLAVLLGTVLLYRYFFDFCATVSTYFTYSSLVAYQEGHALLKTKSDNVVSSLSKEEIYQRYRDVQGEYEKLKAENVELQALLSYSKDIKELDAFRKRCFKGSGDIVQILATIITPTEHSILIHAGERENVKEDMVAVYKNGLVGRVIEVYPFYSKVALVTDKKCSVAGYCFKTKATGVYSGTNEMDCAEFNFVNHLAKLKEGDRLISSGKGLVYPQGLGLGTIKSYKKSGVYYTVKVEPLFDIESLEYCLLMSK